MNERDVEGFKKVMEYLQNFNPGYCISGSPLSSKLYMLKYLGLGEGADYEPVEEWDFKDLIRILKKEHTDEAKVAGKV